MRRMPPFMVTVRDAVLETVYPPRCAECGHRGVWVCSRCAMSAGLIEPACDRCGASLELGCCCDNLSGSLDWLRSALVYEGWARKAIANFKYENERARARHLAQLMAPHLAGVPAGAILVPTPLHPSRQRDRNYNQSEELAQMLKGLTGLDVAMLLTRIRATRPQMTLSAVERAANVKGAFEVGDASKVAGASIVLIDDVFTTGATLAACADALKRSGAAWVGAVTVARDR